MRKFEGDRFLILAKQCYVIFVHYLKRLFSLFYKRRYRDRSYLSEVISNQVLLLYTFGDRSYSQGFHKTTEFNRVILKEWSSL